MKIAIVGSRNVTVPDIGKYVSNAEANAQSNFSKLYI